jgi:hypothetical protein
LADQRFILCLRRSQFSGPSQRLKRKIWIEEVDLATLLSPRDTSVEASRGFGWHNQRLLRVFRTRTTLKSARAADAPLL